MIAEMKYIIFLVFTLLPSLMYGQIKTDFLRDKINDDYTKRKNRNSQSDGSMSFSASMGSGIKQFAEDIDDMESWGLDYTFSSTYQVNLNSNIQISYLQVGLGIGAGFNHKPQFIDNNKSLKTNFQISGSLGLYLKYISLNCGVGCAVVESRTTESIGSVTTDITISEGNNITQSSPIEMKKTEYSGRLLLTPSISGYIPIDSDDRFVKLTLGYNFAPNYSSINGWVFGVGFQIP